MHDAKSLPRRLLLDAGPSSAVFEVLADRVVLGRDPSADIPLDDPKASRTHAEIRRDGPDLVVCDLGSANGTVVNGLPIFEAHRLERGDAIEIGNLRIHVDERRGPPRNDATVDDVERRAPGARARRRKSSTLTWALGVGALAIMAVIFAQAGGGGGKGSGTTGPAPSNEHAQTTSRETHESDKEPPRPPVEESSLEDRVGRAISEQKWAAAEYLLRRLDHPLPLVARYEEAQRAAVAQIKLASDGARTSGDVPRALGVLSDAVKTFPPESVGRRAVVELLLSQPDAPRLPEAVAVAAPGVPAEGTFGDHPREAPPSELPPTTPTTTPPREVPAAASSAASPGSAAAGTPQARSALEEALAHAYEAMKRADTDEAFASFTRAESLLSADLHPRFERQVKRGLRALAHHRQLVAALARVISEDPARAGKVPHLPGKTGRVVAATEEALTLEDGGKALRLKWRLVPAGTLRALVRNLNLPADSLVSAAAVLYDTGDELEADKVLARAIRRDAAVKPSVDQVLADHRRMPEVPAPGFSLVKDRWLSPQEIARADLLEKIDKSCTDLGSDEPAVRRHAFETLMGLGDGSRSRLHRGLLLAKAELKDALKKTKAWGSMQELAQLRNELDRRRQHALELIYDATAYPYPYRPPEAPPEAAERYKESQPEVKRRVDLVRELWEAPRQVRVPELFRHTVIRLKEVDLWIKKASYGEAREDEPWLMNLPRDDTVTLMTVATGTLDRERIDRSVEIMAQNDTDTGPATLGEKAQIRVTNEYRLLLGRWALKIYAPMVVAAHDHCVDMERLGFFAHQSPVPGKRTPTDRLRKAGMNPVGGGENIARSRGPDAAHNQWIRSPGHHRNLLSDGWRLMGPGNSGGYWCQVFAVSDRKGTEKKEPEEDDGNGDGNGDGREP